MAEALPVLAIAATGYSIYKQDEAASRARKESRRAQEEAIALQAAHERERQQFEKEVQKENQAFVEEQRAEEKNVQEQTANLENRNSARARQRARAKGAFGRSDTILTGPLGLPEDADTLVKKTILGS